jgi:predicted RNA-binding Zn-ribbon protein involved in translation (DUF1610 family)
MAAHCPNCHQQMYKCQKCGNLYCTNKAKCGFTGSANQCPKCGAHAGKPS